MRAAAGLLILLALPAGLRANSPGLPLLPAAELVIITVPSGPAAPVGRIDDAMQVAKLEAFVDHLPEKWKTPWYGPPVGRVYFNFYRNGKPVSNFYVGPNFFGRDLFGPRGADFLSQPAAREQVDTLSKITGFDLWQFIHGKSP